jgi:hypothetical protein
VSFVNEYRAILGPRDLSAVYAIANGGNEPIEVTVALRRLFHVVEGDLILAPAMEVSND